MNISKCRNCNFKLFDEIFSFGNLKFTGKFPSKKNDKVPGGFLNIVMCRKCKLVQLDRSFKKEILYGKDYGYRTGINQTMTQHVKSVVLTLEKKVKLSKDDYVLDIASNDGTLLKFYKNKVKTVGVDPTIKKYKKFYKKINFTIPDFFNLKKIKKKFPKKKFKLITVLSMFYDLENPNKFLSDIKEILHQDGIFLMEHADLLSILKNNIFDTFCHEHLEYYSSKNIVEMVKKNGLRVFKHSYNNVNGGSSQYFICHEKSKFKSSISVLRALNNEKNAKINNKNNLKKFFETIENNKTKLNKIINRIKKKGGIIHGYGASTKGNVLLQYFNLDNSKISYIAERNPFKYNKYTPGTKIKIISENYSRKISPDYYLVLPWHFKNEILLREKNASLKGTKFIFPMPSISIK